MPPKRRGGKVEQPHTPSWTELFHSIAVGVLKETVQGSVPARVIGEIPSIAKSAVQYMQGNTNKNEKAITNVSASVSSTRVTGESPSKGKSAVKKNVNKHKKASTNASGSSKKANHIEETNITHYFKPGSVPIRIIEEIPAKAKSAVPCAQKNTNNDSKVITKHLGSDQKPSGVNETNITYNLKQDVNIISDTCKCSVSCTENKEDLNGTNTENLEESFVYLEYENDSLSRTGQFTQALITGLPAHVTVDQVLQELAKNGLNPIAVEKGIILGVDQINEPCILVNVPDLLESRLWPINKILGHKVNVQKKAPEQQISKCIEVDVSCDTCELVKCDPRKETSEYNFLESDSNADLGYNSVNSNHSKASHESICKVDIFSSSRNSTSNSPNLQEECNEYFETIPKETYLRDTEKLMKELKEIKKELEYMKFEHKKKDTKKVDSEILYVSLQGIPNEIKNEDIKNDLKSKNFSVKNVYRLKNEYNELASNVVFELRKDEDHIFYLRYCLGYEVFLEEYKGDFSQVKNSQVLCNTFCKDVSPEKPFNILFVGIPRDISESDILGDLKEKQFHPIAVHIMVQPKRYLLGKTNHGVLVQVPAEEVHIYDVSCILGFPVTGETVDTGTFNVEQCETCLQFGHTTGMCSNITNNPIRNCENVFTGDGSTLNVVVKGIPIEFNDCIVLNDLLKNGFSPIAIHRMAVNDEILPTYLVQVPKQEKRILQLICCLGFSVKVEEFKPHLYHIEQCQMCLQFGKHNKDCMKNLQIDLPLNKIKSEVIENTVNIRNSVNDINNSEKIETHLDHEEFPSTKIELYQEESIFKKTELDQEKYTSKSASTTNSTEMEYLEQQLTNKFDNLEVILKEFINKNIKELPKLCCCSHVAEISTSDVSTNTDNTYAEIKEMTDAVTSYETISDQFVKNMVLFTKAFAEMNNDSGNIGYILEAYLKLNEISVLTSPFVEAMIRILKSTTNLMLDIPDLPGVTINSINEQLHLLEKLQDVQEIMNGTPNRLTPEYDTTFPKLE